MGVGDFLADPGTTGDLDKSKFTLDLTNALAGDSTPQFTPKGQQGITEAKTVQNADGITTTINENPKTLPEQTKSQQSGQATVPQSGAKVNEGGLKSLLKDPLFWQYIGNAGAAISQGKGAGEALNPSDYIKAIGAREKEDFTRQTAANVQSQKAGTVTSGKAFTADGKVQIPQFDAQGNYVKSIDLGTAPDKASTKDFKGRYWAMPDGSTKFTSYGELPPKGAVPVENQYMDENQRAALSKKVADTGVNLEYGAEQGNVDPEIYKAQIDFFNQHTTGDYYYTIVPEKVRDSIDLGIVNIPLDPKISSFFGLNEDAHLAKVLKAPGLEGNSKNAPTGQPQTTPTRSIVRTGTDSTTGRKVIQYSDGSIEYAN